MFNRCSSLKEINLSNFNTDNETDMYGMFRKCLLLNELNFPSFSPNNVTYLSTMFEGCSDELKKKIKKITKNED